MTKKSLDESLLSFQNDYGAETIWKHLLTAIGKAVTMQLGGVSSGRDTVFDSYHFVDSTQLQKISHHMLQPFS